MSASLGIKPFIAETRDRNGDHVISIACERTVYQRRNGTVYIVWNGKRHDLTVQPDGSYILLSISEKTLKEAIAEVGFNLI